MTDRRSLMSPMLLLVVALLAVCPGNSLAAKDGPLKVGGYPYHRQLDNNYSLEWNFNSTHIIFHVKVKTRGWISLGISSHGDMFPGDMVIAWMEGTTVHFHDRHATGRTMPIIDKQQDWKLLEFRRENDMYNTFTVVRKINTCDEKEDLPIQTGTTRVIYAYSITNPSSDTNIPYHGTLRGGKSILLLDPPPADSGSTHLPSDVTAHDFLNNNYRVPSKDTTYNCIITKFRPLQGKHHLIRFEPVIQAGHEKLVHHVLLYFCNRPIPDYLLGRNFECYENQPKEVEQACQSVMVAWSIGGTAFNYPAHVGHSLGTDDDPTYFKLETHYDNFNKRSDFVDNSGLRLFLTKQLRQYDAGMLEVGMAVEEEHVIPPGFQNFLSRAYCPAGCLDPAIGDKGIRIFADLLHSHLIGKRLATRHIRDGVELPPISKDDNYDFNYQETHILPEERVIKRGDTLMTDCVYDSTSRKGVTYGGLSSRQEMCISFLLYYPRNTLSQCMTRLLYKKDRKSFYKNAFDFVNTTDWTIKSNRDEFANNVAKSDVINGCFYSNRVTLLINSTQPLAFEAYVPEDVCNASGSRMTSSTSGPTLLLLVASVLWMGISSL